MRKTKIALAIFTVITVSVLLSNSIVMTYASSLSNNEDDDKYAWLDYAIAIKNPKANATKRAEIKALALKQFEHNEKRIKETKGAILTVQPTITRSSSYMSHYNYTECWDAGVVYNPTYVEGTIDSNYARFYTPDEDSEQIAGIVGEMNSLSGGDVYFVGKLGPTGAGEDGNGVLVWGSNSSSNEEWNTWLPIGIIYEVTVPYNCPYNVYIWAGEPEFKFTSVSIGVFIYPDYPCYFYYNDVMISAIHATNQ